ncbi:MAG: DUF488 domain-containing protein [Gemmatimonadaceae bacterium]
MTRLAETRKAPLVSPTIFTIGHSTRTMVEFVALLKQVNIELLVDVRSIPRSRTTPQFNRDVMPESLGLEGIGYQHLPSLGGRRHHPKGAPPSNNTFWRVLAFRNYADYSETDAFRAGLDELLALGREHRCAIMCAEAVWWRCHRRIITDYLLIRGVPVEHIMGLGNVVPATVTPGSLVMLDATLSYPAPDLGADAQLRLTVE